MARTHHTRSNNGAHHPPALEANRAAPRKKKPYKVVLEAVTQEKKKLHSILSYASNPPPGFGFIPAGHPEFTEWCKEQCRQRNLDVHVVSARPSMRARQNPNMLSHHVHRIGHHFPMEIVQLACNKFNYTYDEENGLRKGVTAVRWIEKRMQDYNSRLGLQSTGGPTTENETKEHISGAVRELFPKIPEADLSSIVNHAFAKDAKRVGNATELSLARRVQLAVGAHVRHNYTEYDQILQNKTGTWREAREKVEATSLAKLKEWRDDIGEESDELEETFREVIVLDDDDDEEVSSDDGISSPADKRQQSMEIVSSRATARELQPELYAHPDPIDARRSRRAPKTIFLGYGQTLPAKPNSSVYPALQSVHSSTLPPVPMTYAEPRPQVRAEPVYPAYSRAIDSRMGSISYKPSSRPAPLKQGWGPDGVLYNLEPMEDFREPTRLIDASGLSRVEYPHATNRHVQSLQHPSPSDMNRNHKLPAVSRRPSEQDVAIPSVEGDAGSVASPQRVADNQRPIGQEYSSRTVTHGELQSPKRKGSQMPTRIAENQYFEPISKRLRPVHDEQDAYLRPKPSHSALPRQIYDYEPVELRTLPRAQRPPVLIDLTSSPHRPSYGGDREMYAPMHAYPAARASQAYVSVSRRVSPSREGRGLYHQPPGELAPAYVYEQDRVFERRPLPPGECIALRGDERMIARPVGRGGSQLH